MSSHDDDAFTGPQAVVFLIIIGACLYGLYTSFGYWKEDSDRARCEGLHDNFDCRVRQQIKADARLEIKRQEKIIRDNE